MPALANPLSPEERLDAIRQALVKRAMEGPTEVRASAFIDGNGVLREASSFVTGMEVRGVRVMAYGRDMDQQAAANIVSESSKPISPNGCKPSKSPVWHQMTWESVSVPMPVAYQYEAQQIEFQWKKMAWVAGQQSGVWRLNERKYVSDTYERLSVKVNNMCLGCSRSVSRQPVTAHRSLTPSTCAGNWCRACKA